MTNKNLAGKRSHQALNFRRGRALRGLMAAFAAATQPSQAQVVPAERIEVTGSHIKRLEGETALPVTVMTREEIARSGATTVGELFDRISANVPAYSLASGLGDSGTPGLVAAGLRGLGSTNTLVLLNGRRLSNYAFNATGGGTVNLNQIPLAAVERVEVLRDGASAIYGSDAIGGVVNFVLRRDFRGADASANGTHVDRGGGETRRYTAAAGYGDLHRQGFNLLATFDHQETQALAASQRGFARTAIRPDLGFAAVSLATFPANLVFGGLLNASAARGCMPEAGAYQVARATGLVDPTQRFCTYDFTSVLQIFPASTAKGLFVRGAWQAHPHAQLVGEFHRSRNEVTFAASETPVGDFRYPSGGPYYPSEVVLPDGTAVRPTGDLPFGWRAKPAGLRTNRVESDESRGLLSAQARFAGWDLDAAVMRSESRVADVYTQGFLRASIIGAGIGSGLIDVFSGRPLDPAGAALVEAAQIRERIRDSRARVESVDLRVSRDLFSLRHGTLSFASGVERRRERLDDLPSDVLFTGDILGFGGAYPETQASREITSAFVEANIPLASALEAQLALRHDRYEVFGATTNPKVALRWNPGASWLLRASAGSGFRAPTLSDLYLPRFINQVAPFSDPARCPGGKPIAAFVDASAECASEVPGQFGGNDQLQPERSRQATVGIGYEPRPGWSLVVDLFAIHLRDRIGPLFPSTVMETYGAMDPTTGNGFIMRGARDAEGRCVNDPAARVTPSGVPCPIESILLIQRNRGKSRTNGADLSASARWNTVAGVFGARLDGTYVHRYYFQRETGGPYFANQGRFMTDNFATAIPRWKHYASFTWQRGPWSLAVAQVFTQHYVDQSQARRVASNEVFDVQCQWRALRGLELTVGVRNVFDRDPPTSDQGTSFQVGYDPLYADPRGRTYRVALRYAY